ncbi:sensor histidine kinase [Fundidesulfovibrio agrisoli]|uniref:sensor histidine kinase n=1 Tax=Fundidesulfovibrio agrisoli TaxID=2922717 RepID=UPI001FAB9555|nr:PAS domain-containing sensor histidine kinase [Fundidesulfovibrio agrisoli]
MTRKFVILATTALLILGAVMWWIGQRAQNELQAVATRQFNNQQLILAQKVAQDITQHFAYLQGSLLELASIGHKHPELLRTPERAIPPFLEILRSSDVLAIGYSPPGSQEVTLFDADGPVEAPLVLDYAPFLDWADGTATTFKVLYGPCEAPTAGPFKGKTIVRIATRYWPVGTTPDRPGTLFMVVDAMSVAQRYAHDVRSGETGYAWVLDQRGIFLDHFIAEFIGSDAVQARIGRDPNLDYSRIETIMRDHILKGQEGVDWYVSGWHRGARGEVRKLIAYTPARIAPDQPRPLVWGVAVVAPVEEVEGIIGQATRREMLMVAAFQAVVFMGLAVTIYFSMRWSSELKSEVEIRTSELREARDKITENLRTLLDTQERLIRSERFAAIGEAASHISHEIKNPLMLMAGFARQVRRTLDAGSKEHEKLRMVEEEAKRLETLLMEVRDFTRPSAPRLEPLDLNATVADTLKLMETELAARGVELRTELAEGLPPVLHDPGQLRQVIINLIKNAAEAMPEGGHVAVTTSRNGGSAEIIVRDSGPGLPPEQLKLIFNPFYTTKERGTGLGLSVCYRILQDHQGDIRAASEPGKGCEFTVSLPVG